MTNSTEENLNSTYKFQPYISLRDLKITTNQTLVVNIKKILRNGIPLPGIEYESPKDAFIAPNESDQFIFKLLIFDHDEMYYKLQAFGDVPSKDLRTDFHNENTPSYLYPINPETILYYDTHIPVSSLQVYVHHPYYDKIWCKQLHESLEGYFNISKDLKIAHINDVSNDPDGFNLEIEIRSHHLNDYLIDLISERLGAIRSHIQAGAINILIRRYLTQSTETTIDPKCTKIQIRNNEQIWVTENLMSIEIYISINFIKEEEEHIIKAYLKSLSSGTNKIILPSVHLNEFTHTLSTIIEEYNSEHWDTPIENLGYFRICIKRSNIKELNESDINVLSIELSDAVSGFRPYLEKIILYNKIYLRRINKHKRWLRCH